MPLNPEIPLAAKGLTFSLGDILGQAQQQQAQRQSMAAQAQQMKAQQQAQEIAAAKQKADVIAQTLQGVTDEASYQMARQRLSQVAPDTLKALPERFDPAAHQQALGEVMEVGEFLRMQADKAAGADRKTGLDLQRQGLERQARAETRQSEQAKAEAEARAARDAVTAANLEADNRRADAAAALAREQAKEAARHNKVMEARPTGQGPQSPIAVLGPDGTPVYVRPADALGKRPASTREQGRAVTSGDAGRISDMDNGLSDVATLRGVVSGNKATGTAAKVGTMVPNWLTEMTGWGTDAKSKNAVIARVKQVIGKTLEGGVLRKEDEEKYKDILPTIADVAEVVATKLDGLEKAIRNKREIFVNSLDDSGFDVSKHKARADGEGGPSLKDPLGIR